MDGRGKTPRDKIRFKVSTIKRYIDGGLTDIDIAKKLHLTLLQWDRYKATHKDIRDLYEVLLVKPKKPFALHNVQYIYDQLIAYMGKRDKDNKPYTIPSICAYLKISKDTYYKYLHENDNKQLITGEDGNKVYTSIADLFKNMHELIEANLIDRAVCNNSVGAIFVLKNHYGYSDKQTLELSDDKTINVTWQKSDSIDGKQMFRSDNLNLSEPKTVTTLPANSDNNAQ